MEGGGGSVYRPDSPEVQYPYPIYRCPPPPISSMNQTEYVIQFNFEYLCHLKIMNNHSNVGS